MKTVNIAAFGALNEGSYEMFGEWLQSLAKTYDVSVKLYSAGPYPNEDAVSVPGRPLRGDALRDPALEEELLKAVAEDARTLEAELGGESFDFYCMPCLSMIGFHDGVERELGKPIVRLADALKDHYSRVDKVGVIYMRPAKERIKEILGPKAVEPIEMLYDQLLVAEEETRRTRSAVPVENIMLEITHAFKKEGLTHVFFARADAPKAQKNLQARIEGIEVDSYFEILARYIVEQAASTSEVKRSGKAV